MDWLVGENLNRKPSIFSLNMGFSCNFSPKTNPMMLVTHHISIIYIYTHDIPYFFPYINPLIYRLKDRIFLYRVQKSMADYTVTGTTGAHVCRGICRTIWAIKITSLIGYEIGSHTTWVIGLSQPIAGKPISQLQWDGIAFDGSIIVVSINAMGWYT